MFIDNEPKFRIKPVNAYIDLESLQERVDVTDKSELLEIALKIFKGKLIRNHTYDIYNMHQRFLTPREKRVEKDRQRKSEQKYQSK